MTKNKFLLAFAALCLFINSANAYESYKIKSGNNNFADLQIYSKGEAFVFDKSQSPEQTIPVASFTSEQRNSIIQATKMWADTINLNDAINNDYATYTTFVYDDSDSPNAQAVTNFVKTSSDTKMTQVNAVLFDKSFIRPPSITDGEILIGSTIMSIADNYIKPTPLHHGAKGDLTAMMYHELAHALGINSTVYEYNLTTEYPKQFPEVLSTWDKNLRVYNTEKKIEISAGANVPIGTQLNNTYDFDLTKYAPYFAGDKTIKVLGNDDDYATAYENIKNNNNKYGKGLVNYATNYYTGQELSSANRTCYGLPILPGGSILESGEVELAHIELRNSLMSHQLYRNWKTFMEAELASMVDIGYDINLRDFFGKSIYLNEQGTSTVPYINNVGFGEVWDGTSYSGINKTDYGIGLHIYGDKNFIQQNADILSEGAGSVGVRIEGLNNNFTLHSGTKIDMTGNDSLGIAATWGSNHTINVENNASVKSTGNDGIAISLDFGDNILSALYETHGSYIYSILGINLNPEVKELDGALVKELNIEGAVEGDKASIYMSHNAFVENININTGANIKGDIISDWNSVKSVFLARVQYKDSDGMWYQQSPDNPEKWYYTNLNINDDFSFSDNILADSIYTLDDKIYLGNTLKLNIASGKNFNVEGNNVNYNLNTIKNEGNINVNKSLNLSVFNGNITGTSGNININNNAMLSLSSNVQNIQNTMNFNGGTLNLMNNVANNININKMNINSDINLGIDIDLATLKADNLVFQNDSDLIVNNDITIYTYLNNTNTVLTGNNIEIPFINNQLKNTNFLEHIYESNSNITEITTPIYKYAINYIENENAGNFVLTHGASGSYSSVNPSIMSSSVGAQVGGYITQINTYDQAFTGMDMMMNLSLADRQAYKMANKYAGVNGGVNEGVMTFSPNQTQEQNRGMWFRPFASFEKVNLNNGPDVENISYGALIGGDSDLIELSHGWDMAWGAYIGYTGSHQNYDGVGIYQNGGTLGLNAAWYKGNFFTGLTANVGASNAQASTIFGNENFTMLSTGIASKTGYNWELFNNKFIIQPSFLISYSFINTFDYTNAAGVKIGSSPLNAIQIVPGLKFIGNLKGGWQPYASVQMIWNIMDETKFYANDVNLPQMSVDPYVQYGVGLQRRWGDRFTGFGQVMLRNGGRTGVVLNAGFRWALGKDSSKDKNLKSSSIPQKETKVKLRALK